ncbi:MAG TPA: hypothetical protein VES95_07695 [Dermatophilaceae bacterium]|nr:hypothetical protein [Dermatophilaceae bacterium]
MSDKPIFDVPEEVTAHLAELLGADRVVVRDVTTTVVPGLGELRAVTASPTDRPNLTRAAVVSEDGTLIDLAAVVAAAGRDPFGRDPLGGPPFDRPPFDRPPFDRPPRDLPAVTVEPKRNDWTLSRCEEAQERITVTVPPNGTAPKADVYLLADTTGSMTGVLAAVAAGASGILNDPALTGFDVAWGVGNYRDFPVDGGAHNSYAFTHQLTPTTTTADADTAIGAWVADEGADTSEGQLYALDRLANDPGIGWRADSKRIIVWFGDAPGHDPVCASLSGLGSDLTEATVTASLVAARVTVVAAGTDTGAGGDLDGDPNLDAGDYGACTPAGTPGQASRITAATGGSYTSGVVVGDIVAELSALIAAAVTSTGNVHLEATGGTAEFVTSLTPAGGYGPLPGDTEHVLTFELGWRGTRACADKEQVFTGSIDVVADGVVVAAKPVRVTVPACRLHHVVQVLCGDQRREDHDRGCTTVEPGHYSTLVTIYNPTTCPVVVEKRLAPLVVDGKVIGREPETVPAKPFARIVLGPGEATLDDCCALEEAVGKVDGLVGVLDVVTTGRVDVTVTHTVSGRGEGQAPSITSRAVRPHRAP